MAPVVEIELASTDAQITAPVLLGIITPPVTILGLTVYGVPKVMVTVVTALPSVTTPYCGPPPPPPGLDHE